MLYLSRRNLPVPRAISDESDSAKDEIAAMEEQMTTQIAQNYSISNNAEDTAESDLDTETLTEDIFNILVIGCDARKKAV